MSRRRLGDQHDCSRYYCVSDPLNHEFYKIDASDYANELLPCAGFIPGHEELCGADFKCFLNARAFYVDHVEHRQIIKGGFTEPLGDTCGGAVTLALAFVFLIGGLFSLCKLLKILFMTKAKNVIVYATKLNDYAAMAVGVVVTIVVQSSSVVTSSLTPFCGLGLLPLEKMLPITVGANIGTTATAALASLSAFTAASIQVALCHLFFNLFGILLWYPVPFMRQVPLGAARLLGLYASFYRSVPLWYVLGTFVIAPGVALGVSALFSVSVAGGVFVVAVLALGLAAFEFWWIRLGGCYTVLSEEARKEGEEALEKANQELRGEP